MPSRSPAQHRLMEGVAHSPAFARKVGIPQNVGSDYIAADQRAGRFRHSTGSGDATMDKGINQHKRMAMGDSLNAGDGAGDFGVQEQGDHAIAHPDQDMTHEPMKDHERGAPPPIRHHDEMHASQAAPDHGPHHHVLHPMHHSANHPSHPRNSGERKMKRK